jgi:Tfp pilus assembly ATPase PilU
MESTINKAEIINNLCYTELVYGRINKKLKTNLSKEQIEALILSVLLETKEQNFEKTGKNFYVSSTHYNMVITVNSYTSRVITASRIKKKLKKTGT